MADGISIGIRASGDDSYLKPRLVLKEGNYRYWSSLIEQLLREKKVWVHVMGTVQVPVCRRPVCRQQGKSEFNDSALLGAERRDDPDSVQHGSEQVDQAR